MYLICIYSEVGFDFGTDFRQDISDDKLVSRREIDITIFAFKNTSLLSRNNGCTYICMYTERERERERESIFSLSLNVHNINVYTIVL